LLKNRHMIFECCLKRASLLRREQRVLRALLLAAGNDVILKKIAEFAAAVAPQANCFRAMF